MEDLYGIQTRRQAVEQNIEKAFDLGFDADNNIEGIEKAKHNVGDIHPNGRWVWTEYAPGKFDWKSLKGKHHKGSQQSTTQQGTDDKEVASFMDKVKTFSSKYNDPSKVSVLKTPKGNWDVSYDGHRLGGIMADQLSEKTAKKMGWLKEEKQEENKKERKKITIYDEVLPKKIGTLKYSDDYKGQVWYDGEVNGHNVSIGVGANDGWEVYVDDEPVNEEILEHPYKDFDDLKSAYEAAKKYCKEDNDWTPPYDMNLDVADEMWSRIESKQYDNALKNNDIKKQHRLLKIAFVRAKEKGVNIKANKKNSKNYKLTEKEQEQVNSVIESIQRHYPDIDTDKLDVSGAIAAGKTSMGNWDVYVKDGEDWLRVATIGKQWIKEDFAKKMGWIDNYENN